MAKLRTIHHGIDLRLYPVVKNKQQYLSFIGRIAPIKGTHIAIDVAQRTGIPLKIAGQVQPINREYFEKKIRPHIDGKLVEYVGPADLRDKNELLGNSMAMLFPIQWNEPFGLVMVEAMACGTPVIAYPYGSVPEIMKEGVSGFIVPDAPSAAAAIKNVDKVDRKKCREYFETRFTSARMAEDYLAIYERLIKGQSAPIPHSEGALSWTKSA